MDQALTLKQINRQLTPYTQANPKRSVWEIFSTLVPYLGIWILATFLLKQNVHWGYVLPLNILGGLFMVRAFIIFHDTCHGSFFKSKDINRWLGRFTGLLTFTPFEAWRQAHNRHHASSGDLDRRGVGDVWTMTSDEFRKASKLKRLGYRLYRNPVVMFGLGPFFMLLISNRFAARTDKKSVKNSIRLTNLALLIWILALSWLIGFKTFLMIQLPIIFVGGLIGIWLFYVQHQFEETYWSKSEQWDVIQAALKGSSYYKLPALLHWLTGNIGYHHVHHLRSGIPFYNLARCHAQTDLFRRVPGLSIKESLKTVKLRLWDEESQRMIAFQEL